MNQIHIVYTDWRGRRRVYHYNSWAAVGVSLQWFLVRRNLRDGLNEFLDAFELINS